MRSRRGYIHIYTGDGKGKTTAALGLAVRALGAGWRVAWFQFLKSRPSAEWKIMRALRGFAFRSFGQASWIIGKPTPAVRRRARTGLRALRAAVANGEFDLVVADELCSAVRLGALDEAEVLEAVRERRPDVELVLTGHGASPALQRAADLVTEMRPRKHYFSRGVRARKGIEY